MQDAAAQPASSLSQEAAQAPLGTLSWAPPQQDIRRLWMPAIILFALTKAFDGKGKSVSFLACFSNVKSCMMQSIIGLCIESIIPTHDSSKRPTCLMADAVQAL